MNQAAVLRRVFQACLPLFMITSRRDYLLRIIDEVGQLLSRVLLKRNARNHQESLQAVIWSCERLFNLQASQLFQFTPEQHYLMLTDGETPDAARDKVLLYAAINSEAGKTYLDMGNPEMAQASFLNAARLILKAHQEFAGVKEPLPEFTPKLPELLSQINPAALDPDTLRLIAHHAP